MVKIAEETLAKMGDIFKCANARVKCHSSTEYFLSFLFWNFSHAKHVSGKELRSLNARYLSTADRYCTVKAMTAKSPSEGVWK